MDVLLTGALGTVGTAVTDHLDHEFTLLDRREGGHVVADVADYPAIRPAFDGQDAVVHLAGYPATDASWSEALTHNVVGTHNVLEAAADAGVESVVFASSNHVVGGYEQEFAPDLYYGDVDLTVDHTDPIRPDSHYGASKACGEAFGRQYVEREPSPDRFYALRIGSVRDPEYDHPYGDAERLVDDGEADSDSRAYEEVAARMHALWQSRRDLAHLVDCCLRDDSAAFEVFYGVSADEHRWLDIEHAREVVGYDPRDGAEWSDRGAS